MRNSPLKLLFLVLFTSWGLSQEADLVLRNGTVWTVDESKPTAEAVAVKDGKFIYVGSDKDVVKHIREGVTEVIDLQGLFVTPGFNDNHVHFEWTGRIVFGLNLLDIHEEKKFINKVREVHKRFAPGVWITGGQWSAYEAWHAGTVGEEGRKAKRELFKPHRKMVDSFTKDRPIIIQRFDGNVFFANAKGLELAGIGRDLSNPEGITVERDRKGNPTGILTGANVNSHFQKIIPDRSLAQRLLETQAVLDRCKKFGVTSLSDLSDPLQREIFYTLRNRQALTVRVHSRGYLDQWDKLAALGIKVGAGDEMIRLGTVKAWIDGIMGNSSARFYEPYSHMPGERGRWRSIMFPWTAANGGREMVSNLENLAMLADSAGIQLSVHAIGDEGNGYLLAMMERMVERNGQKDRRFRLVHAQVINTNHFKRFNGLGIVAEVQPYHCTDDMRWMEERIGHERCVGAYAFRSLWDSGAVVCFGSDSPGTNAARYPLNPMLGLYAAVTRQTLTGEPDGGWFPKQKLTIEEAIQAYTLNSAYASFEEEIKGSIAVGKLADMAVLSDNLLEIEPKKIKDVENVITILGGKVIYQKR